MIQTIPSGSVKCTQWSLSDDVVKYVIPLSFSYLRTNSLQLANDGVTGHETFVLVMRTYLPKLFDLSSRENISLT